MILVDTSVWVDYFIRGDGALDQLLDRKSVLIHPFVIGEVAMSNLQNRTEILDTLRDLPMLETATDDDVLFLVAQENLGGTGLSYIDAHLLAAARQANGTLLWTRDKRLHSVAGRLGLAVDTKGRLQ